MLLRMVVFYSSFTWKHWIGLALINSAYIISYRQLASMAKPAYTDSGELIDGGFDMSTGGICGYVFFQCLFEKFWKDPKSLLVNVIYHVTLTSMVPVFA